MSKLSEALKRLGLTGSVDHQETKKNTFSAEEQQIALIENLYIGGYFDSKNIWNMVHVLKGFGEKEKEEKIFSYIYLALKNAEAYKGELESFNAKSLLETLFEEDVFDDQDIEDMITYLRQTAFARIQGQERCDLETKTWMEDKELSSRFISNARTLGVIDAIGLPKDCKPDEIWLLGASAPRMQSRFEHVKTLETGSNNLAILTGERYLIEDLDEKEYIEELKNFINDAKEKKGKLNKLQSLMLSFGEKEPHEIHAAIDLFNKTFNSVPKREAIYHTPQQNGNRPTTKTTSETASRELIKKIDGGYFKSKSEIKIAVVSSQPHTPSQLIEVQSVVIKALKETGKEINISFYPIGKEVDTTNANCVKQINSALGALSAQQYFQMVSRNPIERRRNEELLMFRGRDAKIKSLPNCQTFNEDILKKFAVKPQPSFPNDIGFCQIL